VPQPTSGTPPSARETLLARLVDDAPRSVLAVGEDAEWAAREYLAGKSSVRVESLCEVGSARAAARALDRLGRFELAVVAGPSVPFHKPDGRALVARVRDVHASRIWLVPPQTANQGPWCDASLRALGFARDPGSLLPALYVFDIDTYKRTPAWLNARHWAHPGRWNKARW
jgi:xanthine/CO dehydrogenase XdhC/CoxF family maturation factor